MFLTSFFFFFLADDNVLFCRATTEECHIILDILGLYEAASG